jgi:putative MATE family efflux protein
MAVSGLHSDLKVDISNRQILKMALPISAAILVPQINFITNSIFLGQLGEEALGLAGLTGVYYLIFAVIGHGLNNGLQSLISRRAGEGRVEEIGNLFHQGIRIAMVFAFAGILLTYVIAPAILQFALHSQANVDTATNFLRIRIWGLPFLYIYQLRNALLVGTNQSKLLIVGTLAETISNIFLDYCLIQGRFGFPALGFNGAAIASIVAEALGMFVVYLVIHYKGIGKRFFLFKKWGYDKATSKIILLQSTPLIVQHAISIISWEFFYILIEHHGQRDLAISNLMRNIFGFFGCFTWAFAAASNAMVSNVIGQGMQDRVIELIYKITKLSFGFAFIVAAILNLFPVAFLSLFGQTDDFIQAAIPVVRIVSTALLLMPLGTVWLNAVTGTGNTRINLYIEIAAIMLYCVYVYVVLEVLNLPITYGWMSEWLYWTTLFLPSFFYIKSGKWKGKKI